MELKTVSTARHLRLYLAQIHHYACWETGLEEVASAGYTWTYFQMDEPNKQVNEPDREDRGKRICGAWK